MKRICLFCLALLLCLVSCGQSSERLLYTKDTTIGNGANTVSLVVEHLDGPKINFTIQTDQTNLGEVLLESGLVVGETGAYGLYIKTVNGITHDYEKDGTYWSFLIDGEYAMSGVGDITIAPNEIYTLKATR